MKNRLAEKLGRLRELIGDNGEALGLLDEALTLKAETVLKPVELELQCDDVVKRYPVTEAMEIVRLKTAIAFHSTCFWVVAQPTLANNMKGGALYETLQWYCDYMDGRDGMKDEKAKESLDIVASQVVNILTLPLDVFTDPAFMLNVSSFILEARNIYYSHISEAASEVRDDTYDDILDNAIFEKKMQIAEQLEKELSETEKKKRLS